MIKITKLTDIWKAETIPEYISRSMEKQLLKLCKEWLTDDIGSFGAFFFVESKSDLDNYAETGMTERIETAEPEWITIVQSESRENCFQICHIISDSFAVYIFCKEKYISGFSS